MYILPRWPVTSVTLSFQHFHWWNYQMLISPVNVPLFVSTMVLSKKALEMTWYILWVPPNLKNISWLFKYLKVDSIHLSSRLISAMIYLKVVGAQNHPNILSYQKFCSKESYLLFATKLLIVKNVKIFPTFSFFYHGLHQFWPSFT